MIGAVGGIERGCGFRVPGGIYAECGLKPGGSPLEAFLLDPPHSVDGWNGITPVGVTLIYHPETDVHHIVDWIGSEYYPNPTDFLEELRRFGLSRRLKRTFEFGKLSVNSRILCVHARAGVAVRPPGQWSCPQDQVKHKGGGVECAGALWEDVVEGDPPPTMNSYGVCNWYVSAGNLLVNRVVWRVMPAFRYYALSEPEGQATHFPAIFASFPISRIVGIEGKEGVDDQVVEIADKVPFPCVVVPA